MNSSGLPPVAAVSGENTPLGSEIREVFSRCLTRISGGAQLVVTRNGETIVDLAGGGIEQTTPIQLFSVSKLVVAIAAAHAHETGRLDLDAPLASYWPEFARPSTRTITARMVLNHSSGICAIDHPLSQDELIGGELNKAVAVQEPYWEPGTAHGYHAFTFGALMSGVFEHALDMRLQEYANRHVVDPSGGGFTFGASTESERAILAQLSFEPPILTESQFGGITTGLAFLDGSMAPIMQDAPTFFGNPLVQAADWPAMSGVGNAQAIVRILNSALGLGTAPLLSPKSVAEMTAEQTHGMDRTLGHISRFGSGVELPHGFMPYMGESSFGHQGAGGSVAVAHRNSGTVVVYTSTHTSSTVGGSDAAIVLMSTVRQVLELD